MALCGDLLITSTATKAGGNISRAMGSFIQLSFDLSPIGEAAWSWKTAGKAFAREVIEETTETGASNVIRNNADDIAEQGSSLYQNITQGASIKNVQTDVTPTDFISNLEKNGFSKSISKDGMVTNLEKGELKYSIRTKAVGQKPPSVNVFKNSQPVLKIRLKQ